jgi:hypothetical protein
MTALRLPHRRLRAPLALLTLTLLLLAGCNPAREIAITHSRELPPKEQQPRTGLSSQERFRLPLSMMGFNQRATAAQPALAWDVPAGWTAVSGSSMRQADLRFGKDNLGECYVMRAGGSLSANVNRWRQQMGLGPLPEQDVAQLPTRPLFGMDAYLVSLDGDYTGMGATGSQQDYRLLGIILPFDDVSLFVKMVGPRDDVAANEASFHAFCDSLRISKPE